MNASRLSVSLLCLRLTLFVVMGVWTIDKFVEPDHMVRIFEGFYGLGGVATPLVWAIAAAEVLILLAFVAGVARTWTYGFVMVAHGASTVVSFNQYLHPFTGANILFFAAWPMWAAAIALFLLRDEDRLLTIGRPA